MKLTIFLKIILAVLVPIFALEIYSKLKNERRTLRTVHKIKAQKLKKNLV